MTGTTSDGRLRKGERRRRAIIDATVAVIGRAGVAGVTQRAVGAEAGVPPSTIVYYFPTVDDLLLTTLADVNDAFIAELARCAARSDRLDALAEVVSATGERSRAVVSAEFELFLLAGRGERYRRECERWSAALDEFFAPWGLDAARARLAAAAVDGLLLRAFCLPDELGRERVLAILRSLVSAGDGQSSSSS